MSRRDILRQRLAQVRSIAARYGAANVRLIGSVARGDERPDSDVDLVVAFEPQRTLLDHAALILDLQDLLGFKVDVLSESGLKGRFRDEVLREAVPI